VGTVKYGRVPLLRKQKILGERLRRNAGDRNPLGFMSLQPRAPVEKPVPDALGARREVK
jgi:hypothetical protein